MKQTELRIGNYISASVPFNAETITYFENSLVQEIGAVYVKLQNRLIPYEYVKRIPLTEEWLVKLGFDKRIVLRNDFYEVESVMYVPGDVEYRFSMNNEPLRQISFVHQLQNLYHALTGEELTIKP